MTNECPHKRGDRCFGQKNAPKCYYDLGEDCQQYIPKGEPLNHQDYYGGDDTYEVLKVIEAWKLPYHLGCVAKYIRRAGFKDPAKEVEDLKKAQVYLNRYISMVEKKKR